MDYIISTMKDGKQHEVFHWCEKIKDNDRLFVFEMDNHPYELSPLRNIPDWENIIKITYDDFPFKSFCIHVQHQLIDAVVPKNIEMKYNVCMLNRRPAPIRVAFMKYAEHISKFIGTMYVHGRIERNYPDFQKIEFTEGYICVDDRYFYHPNDDLSTQFNIPIKKLTETPTKFTREKIGKKYKREFDGDIIPPLEWFETYVDLFHEGDQFFSEKLAKCFVHKKPFFYLGTDQRNALIEYGFKDYFDCNPWFTDVLELTQELCLDIDMLQDYDVAEKIENNYERALGLYKEYGELSNFILNLEINGPKITENTEIMDSYVELLGTISSH